MNPTLSRLLLGMMYYLLFVIGYGAFVRATGAGAGCGNHWPLCNGEFVPWAPTTKTLIEYTHRITSGLVLPMLFGIMLYARKVLNSTHPTRKWLRWTLVFVLTEVLFGAMLVRLEHVADNRSMARAGSMSLHLINTFFLMASATAAWYWSRLGNIRRQLKGFWVLSGVIGGASLLILTGISGAITALGDTVLPLKGLTHAFSPGPLLHRLRVYHPFIAVASGVTVVYICHHYTEKYRLARKVSFYLSTAIFCQFVMGFATVQMRAPVWLQLVHLSIAHLIWILYVIFAINTICLIEDDEIPSGACLS